MNKKLKYHTIMDIKKIEFESLDEITLINWSVADLGTDEETGEENWVCVEVHLDENDKIIIMEQDQYETAYINDELDTEYKNHIIKLANKGIREYAESI